MNFDKILARFDRATVKAAVRLLSLIFLAAIVWGTLAPSDPIPRLFSWQDKLEHLACFMALAVMLCLGASRWGFAFSLAITWTLAIGVEYGQAIFTLHREFSWPDAVASALGGFIGAAAGSVVRRVLKDRDTIQVGHASSRAEPEACFVATQKNSLT